MSESQDQWQEWLDQGYIEYEGWNPATLAQGQTVRDYNLSPGTAGGSSAGPRRAGGGSLPFRRETRAAYDPLGDAISGTRYDDPKYDPSRTGTWEVKDKQDIIDYLEFVNRMGVHNEKNRAKLGVKDYTSADVWEFFERPGEMDRFEGGRKGIVSAVERARRGAASEAALRGSRKFGEGQSEFQARLPGALASYGGIGAEQALQRGMKRIAQGIEGSAARGSTASGLLAGGVRGFGDQITAAGKWAEQGQRLNQMAGSTMGISALVGAPLSIGGELEAAKYSQALDNLQDDLAPADLPQWSSRIADTTGAPKSVGTTESALGQLFPSDERRRKRSFQYT